jgi:ribosomal protein L37AE/L43A
MPWKLCPRCERRSYSSSDAHQPWICPYCGRNLTGEAALSESPVCLAPPEPSDGTKQSG